MKGGQCEGAVLSVEWQRPAARPPVASALSTMASCSQCVMMMMLMTVLLTVTLRCVSGHGRLVEPPSRSSMWRYGFDTPHNYDDNAINCGGLYVSTLSLGPESSDQ